MPPTSKDKPKLNTKGLKKALMQAGHHDKIEPDHKKKDLLRLYKKYCMGTPEPPKKKADAIKATYSSERRAGINHQYEVSPPQGSPIPQTTNHSIHIDDSFSKDKTEDSQANNRNAARNAEYIAQQLRASRDSREPSLRAPSVASVSETTASTSRVRRSQSREVHTHRDSRDGSRAPDLRRSVLGKAQGKQQARTRERRSESVLRDIEDIDEQVENYLQRVDEESEQDTPTHPHTNITQSAHTEHQSRFVLVAIYTWLCVGLSLVGFGLNQIQTTRSTVSICAGRPDSFSPMLGGVCQSGDLTCGAGYELYQDMCVLQEEKLEMEHNTRNIRLLMASENLYKRLRRHEGFVQCGYTDAPGLYWTGEAHVIKEEFAMESDNLLLRMIEVINKELCPVVPKSPEDPYADSLPRHLQIKTVLRPQCVFLSHEDADPYIYVHKDLAVISIECRLRRWVRTLAVLMACVFGLLVSVVVTHLRRKRKSRTERETQEAHDRLLREAKAKRLHSNEPYIILESFRKDCMRLYEADVVDEAILRARHDARVQTSKMVINGNEQRVLRWLDDTRSHKEEPANTSFLQNYAPTPAPKGPIYPTL